MSLIAVVVAVLEVANPGSPRQYRVVEKSLVWHSSTSVVVNGVQQHTVLIAVLKTIGALTAWVERTLRPGTGGCSRHSSGWANRLLRTWRHHQVITGKVSGSIPHIEPVWLQSSQSSGIPSTLTGITRVVRIANIRDAIEVAVLVNRPEAIGIAVVAFQKRGNWPVSWRTPQESGSHSSQDRVVIIVIVCSPSNQDPNIKDAVAIQSMPSRPQPEASQSAISVCQSINPSANRVHKGRHPLTQSAPEVRSISVRRGNTIVVPRIDGSITIGVLLAQIIPPLRVEILSSISHLSKMPSPSESQPRMPTSSSPILNQQIFSHHRMQEPPVVSISHSWPSPSSSGSQTSGIPSSPSPVDFIDHHSRSNLDSHPKSNCSQIHGIRPKTPPKRTIARIVGRRRYRRQITVTISS